jgi:hypothetical protein
LQGVQGEVGPEGDIGSTGATGEKGDTGATGATGADGKSAFQVAVDNGFIGSVTDWLTTLVGPKGDKGEKGDTGATGETGATGATGATGERGLQGIQGEQGVQGETGAVGAVGPKGDTGATGNTGAKGDKGDTGATGPQGATGFLNDSSILTLYGVSNFRDLFSNIKNSIDSLSFNLTYLTNRAEVIIVKSGTGGGTITSSPSALSCGTVCKSYFTGGTTVSFTATADADSTFAGWSGACGGSGGCTLVANGVVSLGANFQKRQAAITVTRSGKGTVTSSTGDIYCGNDCDGNANVGSTVTLTATPDASSTFAGWSGVCSGTSSCSFTMDSSKTVGATFTSTTYQLLVQKAGTGSGQIASTPAGIACGSTCAATFDYNSVVALSAIADPTSSFAGWSGACSGMGTCVVTMGAAKTATATFMLNYYPFTVTKSGTGDGTVASSPYINCGSTCSNTLAAGSTITLSATPDANSVFAGWTGACTGTGGCTVTIDAAKNLGATFTKKLYVLSVSRTGAGSVVSSPAGTYCGAACSSTFNSGDQVMLMAIPDSTATFAGWTGECTGTSMTCWVTMTGAKSVTARFQTSLAVSVAGTGGGTVASSPPAISCASGSCSALFDGGSSVTLTASPDSTSSFAGWNGACVGTGSCTVSMDAAKNVQATFNRNMMSVSVAKSGTGSGTVSSSPSGVDCGSTCTNSFVQGTQVTLTATASSDSTFAYWTGDCTGSSPTCIVTASGTRSVTANFNKISYLLSVSRSGHGTVVSDTPAIYCGYACSSVYGANTMAVLYAYPDANYTFNGWAGMCTGTQSTCAITMNSAKSVSATFS